MALGDRAECKAVLVHYAMSRADSLGYFDLSILNIKIFLLGTLPAYKGRRLPDVSRRTPKIPALP
jgi:hypothetical protein